jgi:uncharacterized membrane protein YoaK (UPF0700 family)
VSAPVDRRDVKVALAALTVASSSLDVTAFLRLGGLFASVMTSNLIFVGLAVVKAERALGVHCAVALACYVAGVGAGSRVARPSGKDSMLGTVRLSLLLSGEAVLLVGYAVWWIADGAHPSGWQQLVLLGAVTFAMGLQGAAARQLGAQGAGTTYMTGTLTGAVAAVAGGRRPDVGALVALAAVLCGAAAGAGLLVTVPDVTPFLAVAGVGFTAAMSWGEWRRRFVGAVLERREEGSV